MPEDKNLRVGVFIDGNFFLTVSNYYRHHHPVGRYLSVEGVLRFIERQVQAFESATTDPTEPEGLLRTHAEGSPEGREFIRRCHVVEAHFFRGRSSAEYASETGRLFSERKFEDVLMQAGVVTHYTPFRRGRKEKGVDVWLALEAYELTHLKGFDVVVLIAGDADFVPLVRKLTSLGSRVMIVGWELERDVSGKRQLVTGTAEALSNAASYTFLMTDAPDQESEDGTSWGDVLGIFEQVEREEQELDAAPDSEDLDGWEGDATTGVSNVQLGQHTGVVLRLESERGYGFLRRDKSRESIFFHASHLRDRNEWDRIVVDARVKFALGSNEHGLHAVAVELI